MPESARAGASGRLEGWPGLINLLNLVGTVQAQEVPPEEPVRRGAGPAEPAEPQPGEVLRIRRFGTAWKALEEIDPRNRAFETLAPPGYVPTEADIARLEGAVREAYVKRTCDCVRPDGRLIGEAGTSPDIREMSGGLAAAQQNYDDLSQGGTPVPFAKGSMSRLPYDAGTITFRPVSSTPGSPAIDTNIPRVIRLKLHY